MLLAEMLQRFSISYQNSPAKDSDPKVKSKMLDFWTFLHQITHKDYPSQSLALGFAASRHAQRFSIKYQTSPVQNSHSKVKTKVLDFLTFLYPIPCSD